MTKATGKATTARGLCTDLKNQREAHIDNTTLPILLSIVVCTTVATGCCVKIAFSSA